MASPAVQGVCLLPKPGEQGDSISSLKCRKNMCLSLKISLSMSLNKILTYNAICTWDFFGVG